MAQASDLPGGTRGKSPLPLLVTFLLNFAVVIAGSVLNARSMQQALDRLAVSPHDDRVWALLIAQVSAVAAGSSLLAAGGALFDDALGKALDISAATLLCIATAIVWIVATK